MPFGLQRLVERVLPRPRTMRRQLLTLVAALALPLLGLQAWSAVRELRWAEEHVATESLRVADAAARNVQYQLDLVREMLTVTAGRFGSQYLSAPCDPAMSELQLYLPFAANALVVDRDGSVICSAEPAEARSAAEWPWFPVVGDGASFAISEPLFGTLSDEWILPLAVPIRDAQGRFAGALAVSMPLVQFGSTLGQGLDENVLISVISAGGVVLARSEDAASWVGRDASARLDDGLGEEVSPGRFTRRADDLNGTLRAWAGVRTSEGWLVYAGLPADAVYGPARAAVVRQVGATLLVLLVALAFAALPYQRMAAALAELSGRLRTVSEGEPIVLAGDAPAELQGVVAQFNASLDKVRHVEEAERVAWERYESIFENAVFGMFVSTADGRLLEVNGALVTMLGYRSAEELLAVGTPALYADPGARDKVLEWVEAPTRRSAEVEWLKADGSRIVVRLSGRAVRGEDDQLAYEVIVQDVTEEKRTEEELRHSQKMDAIGKLAGGVAHDLNNMFIAIGGGVELVAAELGPGHPALDDLNAVLDATDRAATLTRQLLAFSRKTPRSGTPVDLNEVLAKTERMLERLMGADVTLVTQLEAELPPVSVDPGELEQIALNLVINARDAMPTGGEIAIATRRGRRPGVGDRAEGVILAVRDTGVGMDEETRMRAFEPFYTTKPPGRGTGLGLSTVYGIVKGADGKITVESSPGAGTTFTVWFPAASGTVADDVVRETPPEASKTGGLLLVVEDDELVRGFVTRALEEAGYEIVTASNGQEALDVVSELDDHIDLVLTDVVMPQMRGPELAAALAVRAPRIPVLFMTGYAEEESLSPSATESPARVLSKPFSAAELRERVAALLARRRGASGQRGRRPTRDRAARDAATSA